VANDAVRPLGSPDAAKLTLPEKLCEGLTVMVDWPDAPCWMDRLPGDAESVKLGAFTVKVRVVETVSPPEMPVTVAVTVPAVAELLAVRVRTLDVVAGLGENAAVTPLGRPEAERLTLPENPYSGLIVIVDVPEVPWLMDTLPGEAARVNVGARTDSERVVVAVRVLEVPVMVTVAVPGVAELVAANVSTLDPVAGFVLHDAVTPLGRVEVTARFTLPVNPPASVTVMVDAPEAPWLMERAIAEEESQKPGTCGPARALIRFCPFALPHPVTRS